MQRRKQPPKLALKRVPDMYCARQAIACRRYTAIHLPCSPPRLVLKMDYEMQSVFKHRQLRLSAAEAPRRVMRKVKGICTELRCKVQSACIQSVSAEVAAWTRA